MIIKNFPVIHSPGIPSSINDSFHPTSNTTFSTSSIHQIAIIHHVKYYRFHPLIILATQHHEPLQHHSAINYSFIHPVDYSYIFNHQPSLAMNTTFLPSIFPFLQHHQSSQHHSPINSISSAIPTSFHPSIFFPSTIKYSSTNFPPSTIILNSNSSITIIISQHHLLIISHEFINLLSTIINSFLWIQIHSFISFLDKNLLFIGSSFFPFLWRSSNISIHIFPALYSIHFIFHYPSSE
ncbi:hypothetical protein PGTUg99_026474 [Puccinia graminis f. sp. tritici]|uniref:Uncharacterized protein n=1 Tax=Puccinia graminis f. sp. tritici TaxID=56615 RepID=A0A5B0SD35_PUCGR|nr:hypothetical protein PGTUg99_026474 [Puccinia graminis f. sp. tritici]